MRDKMYINGIGSISAQPEDVPFSGTPVTYSENIFHAVNQDYKKFIPAMQLRRMASGVKMGITASKKALLDANIDMPEAIITSTGEGSKQETEKFLETMLAQNEEMLSPASFIQSTHNTVGGQIALILKCPVYNVTYTQSSASFEWALLDAKMTFEEKNVKNILVGGVDEISPTITSFLYLNNQLKNEQIDSLKLFGNQTFGTIASEGANFFAISSDKTQNSYAEFLDVEIFNAVSVKEVENKIHTFLENNGLTSKEIDMIVLGKNGDSRYDHFYAFLQEETFKNSQQIAYKHLVGDYNTVSGYALWLACKIAKTSKIPEILKLNDLSFKTTEKILLYNQYLGQNHSLILLNSCDV